MTSIRAGRNRLGGSQRPTELRLISSANGVLISVNRTQENKNEQQGKQKESNPNSKLEIRSSFANRTRAVAAGCHRGRFGMDAHARVGAVAVRSGGQPARHDLQCLRRRRPFGGLGRSNLRRVSCGGNDNSQQRAGQQSARACRGRRGPNFPACNPQSKI